MCACVCARVRHAGGSAVRQIDCELFHWSPLQFVSDTAASAACDDYRLATLSLEDGIRAETERATEEAHSDQHQSERHAKDTGARQQLLWRLLMRWRTCWSIHEPERQLRRHRRSIGRPPHYSGGLPGLGRREALGRRAKRCGFAVPGSSASSGYPGKSDPSC